MRNVPKIILRPEEKYISIVQQCGMSMVKLSILVTLLVKSLEIMVISYISAFKIEIYTYPGERRILNVVSEM